MFRSLIVALLLLTGGPAALAKDVAINAFYGKWSGSAMSETEISTHFQVTSRDLDVRIEPAGAGFLLSWTTIQRQKGAANNPTAVNKTTTMSFMPTDKPNIWRSSEASDPLRGVYAWARIKERTLTVNTLRITDDGGYEMQTYDRTLAPEGMLLRFTRHRDGEQLRTAKGRLVKDAQ